MAKIHNIKNLKENRKKLRNNLTPAEAKLWSLLKYGLLEGRKFRRQHSVGPYVLDFYCPKEKICIELDGMAHFTEEGHEYDTARTEYLSAINIRVLRFENKDVFENTEGVLEVIRKCLISSPPILGGVAEGRGGKGIGEGLLKQTTPDPSLTKEGSCTLQPRGGKLLAFAALAIIACLFACTRTDQQTSGPLEKVTIAYSLTTGAVLPTVAQVRGYYREEGLDAVPLLHPLGAQALREVLEGKADFATVAETPVMLEILKGEKISILATIQTSNKNNAIVARKDKGILTLKNLKGKRIAVKSGTTAHFFLDAILATHGISKNDVMVIDLKVEDTPEALANGNVEAVSLHNPYIKYAQRKLGDRSITFYDEDIYTWTFNIIATQEFVRNNPGKVKKMLRALIKAGEFVKRDPDEAQKIVAGFSNVDMAAVRDIWAEFSFGVTLDQSLVLALEDETRWAIKGGLTKETKVPNYLDYIYLDGLLSVKPEAVRILR